MRFLSKKCIWLFLIVVVSTMIVFLHNTNSGKILKSNQLNILTTSPQVDNLDKVDNTIFNLRYENKVWTFKATDFKLDSNVFSIDARINNLGRNGTRADKIKLISKLININIDPEIAFNYIYFGFKNKLNKIQKNIEKLPKDAEINIKNNKINIKNEITGIKLIFLLLNPNQI